MEGLLHELGEEGVRAGGYSTSNRRRSSGGEQGAIVIPLYTVAAAGISHRSGKGEATAATY